MIRPAACAGSFYPETKRDLEKLIASLMPCVEADQPPAMIVPHAGYVYSGMTAAIAYARLAGSRVSRVVLLAPAHRVWFRGIAMPKSAFFETPLGKVRLDREACLEAASLPSIMESEEAHEKEHAIEVQLPFLQFVLGEFSVVPLLVGESSPESVSLIIDRFLNEAGTLVLVSSDLSHFHPYHTAKEIDLATARSILDLDPVLDHAQACGATPVNGLLISARRFELEPDLLDIRNSGDTAGGLKQVVGYASFSFCKAS